MNKIHVGGDIFTDMSADDIPPATDFGTGTAKTTVTSFRIIEALRGRESAGVSELAEELGLAKGTVHKHLSTLRDVHYVVKEDERYRLSLRFLGLGSSVRTCLDIEDLAYDSLKKLADATGEVASFMVPEHGFGVYALSVSNEDWSAIEMREGESVPLSATAGGKAILAYTPEDERERILDQYGLPEMTTNTITERHEFYEELEYVHGRRVAYDHAEFRDSLHCVASPITDRENRAIAAVTVSGPADRMAEKTTQSDFPTIVKSIADSIQNRATR